MNTFNNWYVYRLKPGSQFNIFTLDRQEGFPTADAASDWVFKDGHKADRPGQTFIFRRYFRDPPKNLDMAAERVNKNVILL